MRDPKERIRSLSTPLRWLAILAALAVILILGIVLYRIPTINNRLAWRIDAGMTTLRTFFSPIGLMPTPVLAEPEVKVVTLTPTLTRQPELAPTTKSTATPKPATATPTPTDAPLPDKISLPEPAYERQDWNSCGPAALAMVLHFYGWEGSQEAINALIKPLRADRNVNIDELASFLTESFWFNDDRWSGHYQLITGYDDSTQRFITQDSFVGPNRMMTYMELDSNWQAFNRAYLLVYPIEQEESIKNALKDDWDVDTNRQHALETAQAETESDPTNPYAWFNLGTNLVYFERYPQAASAYDTARQLELPQRMMRYQFGPFLAYFHGGRTDDLLDLAEYALKATPNSEETLLWKGWALYRLGQTYDAIPLFQEALKARPNYSDAIYALEFMQGQ